MGEKDDEVRQALKDLRAVGVDFVTMGQYLQPTRRHMKVEEYVHPDKFEYWKEEGERYQTNKQRNKETKKQRKKGTGLYVFSTIVQRPLN